MKKPNRDLITDDDKRQEITTTPTPTKKVNTISRKIPVDKLDVDPNTITTTTNNEGSCCGGGLLV